jgi:hypothetical protein
MEDAFGNDNTYVIRRPYELVDPTPYLYSDYEGKGHSTKRGAHNSNAHTKNRKAKRRLNKKHNK